MRRARFRGFRDGTLTALRGRMKKSILLCMFLFGCGVDETAVGEAEGALTGSWSSDTQVPSQWSSYAVGLATYNGRLQMVYTGTDGNQIWSTSFNGSSWSSPYSLGHAAQYNPALTVFQNRLALVYHPTNTNHLVMQTSSDGHAWTSPVNANSALGLASVENAPAATVYQGSLYVAYCKDLGTGGDRVHLDRTTDGVNWTSAADFSLYGTCQHVAIGTRPDGRFDLIYDTSYPDPSNPNFEQYAMFEALSSSPSGGTWVTTTLPMKSKKQPSFVTCGGITHLLHGGFSTEDEVWWSELQSNGTWATNLKLATHSDGGAAVGCLGTTSYMVHNGGTTQLWYAQFYP